MLERNLVVSMNKSLLSPKSFKSNFSMYLVYMLQLTFKSKVTSIHEPYPVLITVTMISKIFI